MTGVDDPRIVLRQHIARAPGDALAWVELADAELDAGALAAGEQAARRALALRPGHPEALARLGRADWMQGRLATAAAHLREAAAAAPSHPGIVLWLGHVLEDAGDAEGASAAYARAHALAPAHPQIAAYLLAWRRRLCDWRDLEALSGQVRAAVRDGQAAVEPFAFLNEDAGAGEQLRCARLKAQAFTQVPRLPSTNPRPASRPLRLGFLSNGFGAHPTGLLVVAFLEALRADADVEPHLFALTADDGSTIRARLAAATHLRDVSQQPHATIATAIRAQRIDVLYDLRGWGGGGAPAVLAMRPAPVQVNWLAYPGTSGAPWIDHVLADGFVLPASLEPAFSERVVRLPRCFQPSDTRRAHPRPLARETVGLPAAGVVFCCFNNSYKFNPRSAARAWAVLHGVPGSVLWLLAGPGDGDARLRAAAAAAGIDPARLRFLAKQTHARYLDCLATADLFLDTHPYNAHTTASDAMWAGCPVLTAPGATFASRVAGSLNHHAGLAHLNVDDDDAFVARAVALGRDPAALDALRREVEAARTASGLFDMDGFARDFAAAARTMASPAPPLR